MLGSNHLRLTLALLSCMFFAPAQNTYAQGAYPQKPIKIIVPVAAGGGTDFVARVVGQKLGEALSTPVIIENKPGAGGNIAASYVARSPANGYTLFLATIGTHAINQNLYKTMPYDGEKDFAPLSRLAVFPNLLVVPANSPYQTVSDLIIFGKNNPGKLTFGSPEMEHHPTCRASCSRR